MSQHRELDGEAPPGLDTDIYHLMKDNLGPYYLKLFETTNGKKGRWYHWETNPRPPA